MVRVLAVSDVVDDSLWTDGRAVRGTELIVGCGDLPFEYLGRLMNALDAPLVFVPGNHDPDVSGYRLSRAGLTMRAGIPVQPPWPAGAVNADGAVVDIAGLRLAGLGGCRRYSDGPNQYTDRQQARRARWLAARVRARRVRDSTRSRQLRGVHSRQLRGGRGLDVLLTHAPPRGAGDGEDPPHQGFTALNKLVSRVRPAVLLHGHVTPEPGSRREVVLGDTVVCNVTGWQLLDIEPGADLVQSSTAGQRHA